MAQAKKALSKSAKKNSRAAQARAPVKSYPNYIGGEWVAAHSGEWFENTNPADTRDVVGRFPASDASDVERAVEAARSAADRWRGRPAPGRGRQPGGADSPRRAARNYSSASAKSSYATRTGSRAT